MSDVTYAAIQHLIAEQRQDTNILAVTFRCPATGRQVDADAILESRETVGSTARDVAKREASWGVFRVVASFFSNLFGGGVAGDIAGSVGGEVASNQVSDRGNYIYSAEEKQAAAVRAFESVREEFALDPATQQWVMRAPSAP